MSWLDAIRDMFASNRDSDQRPYSSEERFGISEHLECRLVLGALSSDTAVVTTSDSNSASSANSTTGSIGSSTTSSESNGITAASASTTSLTATVSDASETPSTASSVQDVSPEATASSGDRSKSNAESPETVLPATGPTTSTSDGASAAATNTGKTNGTDSSSVSNNVLATNSTPITAVDTSTAQSPPAAIDNALTAVNKNVMVSSDMISSSGAVATSQVQVPVWFTSESTVSTIHYDFRDENGVTNAMTSDQIAAAEQVLGDWSAASGGKVVFVRDTQAAAADIVNIGIGDMSAVPSSPANSVGTTIGTSRHAIVTADGNTTSVGTIWLNGNESWNIGAGTSTSGTLYDYQTVMAHEVGHILGLADDPTQPGIMNPTYAGAQDLSGISTAWSNPTFSLISSEDASGFISENINNGQLSAADVSQILKRASVATPSNDAIIAIVDRAGNILGVRVEQGVLDTIKDQKKLAFAIDGAIAKARTAAFFSNDTTAVASRTIQDLSQTTILQREVEADPNSSDPTVTGPGFVAAVGLGGHFPAGIENTPPVDLFNIEASNRDSQLPAAGKERFNIDLSNVSAGQQMTVPISYGTEAGISDASQNRGIGTLPGGLPIYYDPNHNGIGATLMGGIGVFFPGKDGLATYEQGFEAGVGQTEFQRLNTPLELEAEGIAFTALGGSYETAKFGLPSRVGELGGVAANPDIGVLFQNITLKGILLPVAGSTPGIKGLRDALVSLAPVLGTGTDSGQDMPLAGGVTAKDGTAAPSGWLVNPHTSADSDLTVADMNQIIQQGIDAANRTRATLRAQPNGVVGQQNVSMVFAISDKQGQILAMYRMPDSTVFSEDVAVAKARNVAYYNDPADLQSIDQVHTITDQNPVIAAGTSFTSRTFRFLAEPRFPAGVDDSRPPQFSILNDAEAAGINPETGENIAGAPIATPSDFTSVMGHDVFNVGTNFHDTSSSPENQNGIIFFPGSSSLYKNGKMVGGLGVSGDGVNQDDVVTVLAANGFLPGDSTPGAPPVDYATVDGVRLPYFNYTRNPFG